MKKKRDVWFRKGAVAALVVTLSAGILIPSIQMAAAYTPGSVLFGGGGGGTAEDNSNFYWDDVYNRLGIGTSTPMAPLDVRSDHDTLFRVIGTTTAADPSFWIESTNAPQVWRFSVQRNSGWFIFTDNTNSKYPFVLMPNTPSYSLRFYPTKGVINDNQNNWDFIVESTGDTNMFFVDASANRIGIGTNSPNSVLDVRGDMRVTNPADSTDYLSISSGDIRTYFTRVTNGAVLGSVSMSSSGDLSAESVSSFYDVETYGDYTYGYPKTFYLNIPPAAFHNNDPGDEDIIWNAGSTIYINSGVSEYDVYLTAPVFLPDGATVTNFTTYFYDNTGSANLDIEGYLGKRDIDQAVISDMAYFSDSTSGSSSSIQSYYDNTIYSNPIDNQNRQYFIFIYYDQNTYVGASMRFYGCRIEYTLDTLNP